MAALHITEKNFKEEVLEAKQPVLIDFWASWCVPCQMLLPVIEELADEETEVKVCKINVDEQPELASQYGVMSIPTLILMKEGRVLNKTVGMKTKKAIQKMIKKG